MKIKAQCSGFTLIELLVVIAVIAALVTLVIPCLATAKGSGQGARCLGNHRQLTTAWLTYTMDNRGKLTPNGLEDDQPTSPTDTRALPGGTLAQWCAGRQDVTADLSPGNAPTSIGANWIKAGLLYPYVGNVDAFLCPADTGSITAFGLRYPHVRSVSMNTWLSPVGGLPYDSAPVMSYYKDSDLVQPGPSQLFVFIDESPASINDGSLIFDPTINQWIDAPAIYHNGGSGLSFADGHAIIRRWTDPTILVEWTQTIQPGNPNFTRLSPSQNPAVDLNYLQSVSTYLIK